MTLVDDYLAGRPVDVHSASWFGCRLCDDGSRTLAGIEAHLRDRHGYDHDRELRDASAAIAGPLAAGELAAGWTLETFPTLGDRSAEAALDAVLGWLELDPTPSLIVWGLTPGAGKTGLAVAGSRRWIEENVDPRVRFVNVRAYLAELRRALSEKRSPAIEVEELLEARLVVLDDVGADRLTGFALDTLSLIVERRHAGRLPIVTTSNLRPDELSRRISGAADAVSGPRLVSRLVDGARVVHLDRPDVRARGLA